MPITIEGFHHAGFWSPMSNAPQRSMRVCSACAARAPDFGFPGRWYDLGHGHQLHLMGTSEAPGQTGIPTFDRHIALRVPDVEATAQQLTERASSSHAVAGGQARCSFLCATGWQYDRVALTADSFQISDFRFQISISNFKSQIRRIAMTRMKRRSSSNSAPVR